VRRFLFALPLLLAAQAAAAGPRDDSQFWSTFAASGGIGGRWLAQCEIVLRFGDDGTRLYQHTLRGAIGYKLGGKVSAYQGYAHVVNIVEGGPDRREHRPFQQLNFDLGKALGGALTARTRLEERFMEGSGGVGFRLRQQLRLVRPVEGDLSLFASAEGFVALNDTGWGARSGFERLRTAAGLRHPIGKKLNGELGYLNQYNVRRNGRDTMDHALTLAVSLSF
jgi:uncharacterized protein DUF2490